MALGTGALLALPYCWLLLRSAGRIRTVGDVPATSTALVLGAGVRRNGTPSMILLGRLETARELLVAGKVQRVVVSGSPRSRGHSEPIVMRDHLVSAGIDPELVLLDESGVDTWRSCRHAADELGLREITVVTTGFHLPRAVALCRRAGMRTWGVGHDARTAGLRRVATRGALRETLAVIKAFWWRRHP